LFIQAHEADLIHGPQAKTAARSLEVMRDHTERDPGSRHETWNIGDGLIRWGGAEVATLMRENSGTVFHDDDDYIQQGGRNEDEVGVWVDRYVSLRGL